MIKKGDSEAVFTAAEAGSSGVTAASTIVIALIVVAWLGFLLTILVRG